MILLLLLISYIIEVSTNIKIGVIRENKSQRKFTLVQGVRKKTEHFELLKNIRRFRSTHSVPFFSGHPV